MSWSKVRGVLAILTLLFAVIAAPPNADGAADNANSLTQSETKVDNIENIESTTKAPKKDSSCQDGVKGICEANAGAAVGNIKGCDAIMKKETDYTSLFKETDELLKVHLTTSLEYLLIGGKFNQWNSYRQNFHKHFDKLSDDAWNDAVDLIHHLATRGHTPAISVDAPEGVSKLNELSAFAAAHDKERKVVKEILDVVAIAHSGAHDPEMTHYFSEHLTDVRTMKLKHSANHVHTLSQAVLNEGQQGVRDANLVYSIYDQYVLGK